MEPGGYIEQVEVAIAPQSDDGSLTPGHILFEWTEIGRKADETTGKSLFIADKMKDSMERAGFVDVVESRFKLPLGPWSSNEDYKTLGKWYKMCWLLGMESWIMAVCTRKLKVSTEAFRTNRSAHLNCLVDSRSGPGVCQPDQEGDRQQIVACLLQCGRDDLPRKVSITDVVAESWFMERSLEITDSGEGFDLRIRYH